MPGGKPVLRLDRRLENTLDVGGRGRIHLIVDAFNLSDNAIVLGRFDQVNSIYYRRVTDVMQGRTIRLGARFVLR